MFTKMQYLSLNTELFMGIFSFFLLIYILYSEYVYIVMRKNKLITKGRKKWENYLFSDLICSEQTLGPEVKVNWPHS